MKVKVNDNGCALMAADSLATVQPLNLDNQHRHSVNNARTHADIVMRGAKSLRLYSNPMFAFDIGLQRTSLDTVEDEVTEEA